MEWLTFCGLAYLLLILQQLLTGARFTLDDVGLWAMSTGLIPIWVPTVLFILAMPAFMGSGFILAFYALVTAGDPKTVARVSFWHLFWPSYAVILVAVAWP